VMEKARFENMKDSGYGEQINLVKQEERGRFLRKGKVADWKNWFTVAQNEQFDERIVRSLENAGIHLNYE
ncbi:MAG: sulfotransferase domain-containing protein, partial [Steroidobacteraceae bacterium]